MKLWRMAKIKKGSVAIMIKSTLLPYWQVESQKAKSEIGLARDALIANHQVGEERIAYKCRKRKIWASSPDFHPPDG